MLLESGGRAGWADGVSLVAGRGVRGLSGAERAGELRTAELRGTTENARDTFGSGVSALHGDYALDLLPLWGGDSTGRPSNLS